MAFLAKQFIRKAGIFRNLLIRSSRGRVAVECCAFPAINLTKYLTVLIHQIYSTSRGGNIWWQNRKLCYSLIRSWRTVDGSYFALFLTGNRWLHKWGVSGHRISQRAPNQRRDRFRPRLGPRAREFSGTATSIANAHHKVPFCAALTALLANCNSLCGSS